MGIKRLLPVILVSIFFCSSLFAQVISEDEVSIVLVGKHYYQFPNAITSHWEKVYSDGTYYMNVNFTIEKQNHIVKYDMSGVKLELQVNIDKSELYPSIFTDLQLKYGKYKTISLVSNSTFDTVSGEVINLYYILSLKLKSGLVDEFLDENMELALESEALFVSVDTLKK